MPLTRHPAPDPNGGMQSPGCNDRPGFVDWAEPLVHFRAQPMSIYQLCYKPDLFNYASWLPPCQPPPLEMATTVVVELAWPIESSMRLGWLMGYHPAHNSVRQLYSPTHTTGKPRRSLLHSHSSEALGVIPLHLRTGIWHSLSLPA